MLMGMCIADSGGMSRSMDEGGILIVKEVKKEFSMMANGNIMLNMEKELFISQMAIVSVSLSVY